MNSLQAGFPILLSAVCSLSVRSQVAPGEILVTSSTIPGEQGNPGTFLATRSGSFVVVGGVGYHSVMAIDPIDGTVWGSSGVRLSRITMSGISGTESTVAVVTFPDLSFGFIRFDEDGNPIATYESFGQAGGLFRIDRRTSAVTRLRTDGQFNGLAIDPSTLDAYVVNLNWDVLRIPVPYTGQALVITNVTSLLASQAVNSVTFASLGPQGEVFLGARGRVLRLPLATGTATVLTTFNSLYGRRRLEYDRRNGDFWMLEDGGPLASDTAMTMTLAGGIQPRVFFGLIGSPGALAVNDFPVGTLHCAPMNVPQGGSFTLEIGLWGNPGEIAVLALTRPIPILLGTGTFDRGGNYHLSLSVPAGAIAPGNPGALEFMGASIHPQTLQVALSPARRWPKN